MLQEVEWNLQATSRKRAREVDSVTASDQWPSIYRNSNGTPRVMAYWRGASFPLNLSSPILDENGHVNAHQLPGLCFFFAPRLEYVESPVVHVTLSESSTPCDAILQRERRSCPVHGPFSCSCPVMHHAVTMLQALLLELSLHESVRFDIVVDEHPAFPHILIDTRAHAWFLVLVNLPVPDRTYGPIPLAQFDYPSAIRQNLNRFTIKVRDQVPNPCAHCGGTTNGRCGRCNCLICERCALACGGCKSVVCHACCDYTDYGGLVCNACRP